MASAPLVSWAVWRWLTHQPTSGCYGLEDGATASSFPLAIASMAAGDVAGLLCVAPAMALPLVGLFALLVRPERPRAGAVLSVVGVVVHVITGLAIVSTGC